MKKSRKHIDISVDVIYTLIVDVVPDKHIVIHMAFFEKELFIMVDALKDKQLSVTFGFRAPAGYFGSDEAKAEADLIAASGIKWVVLVPTVYQETAISTFQFRDFELTPSDIEVVEMIDYFHSLGIAVQLRPMLEGIDGCGRLEVRITYDYSGRIPGASHGTVGPWFKSMTARAVHYAKIAEKTGCELYCLDSELDHYVISFGEYWRKVVKEVKKVYSGPVTSCHTIHTDVVNFEKALSDKNHWFYDLDMLSISSYYPASDKLHANVEEMMHGLEPLRDRMDNIAKIYGKPILLGECGCCSCTGAAAVPAGWWHEEKKYDPDEQANYLTAVIETFKDFDWWRGLCWWKWDQHVDRPELYNDPAGDKDTTLKGKPALALFDKYTKEFHNK